MSVCTDLVAESMESLEHGLNENIAIKRKLDAPRRTNPCRSPFLAHSEGLSIASLKSSTGQEQLNLYVAPVLGFINIPALQETIL